MSYRDEKETLRARVAQLEGALAERDETLARLTGGAPASGDPRDVVQRSAFLDAPRHVLLERELDFELGDEGFEAIAAFLRPRHGQVTQVGRTLTGGNFSLSCAGGRTRVKLVGGFAGTFAALVGSVLVGGFSALVTFGLVHDLLYRGLSEAHILWMAPFMIFGLTLPFMRKLAQRGGRKIEKDLRATLEGVLEIAKRHAVRASESAPAAKVRVGASEASELAPDEAEHEVEASEAETGQTDRRVE